MPIFVKYVMARVFIHFVMIVEPLPATADFKKLDGETESAAERRRTAIVDAEYNAVTCIALYMLLMSFSQKGVDKLLVHQEGLKMRDPEHRLVVTEGFEDGMSYATYCHVCGY